MDAGGLLALGWDRKWLPTLQKNWYALDRLAEEKGREGEKLGRRGSRWEKKEKKQEEVGALVVTAVSLEPAPIEQARAAASPHHSTLCLSSTL